MKVIVRLRGEGVDSKQRLGCRGGGVRLRSSLVVGGPILHDSFRNRSDLRVDVAIVVQTIEQQIVTRQFWQFAQKSFNDL